MKSIIMVTLFFVIQNFSLLLAKESALLKGLNVNGATIMSSNFIWRGKTWSDDSPAVIIFATLAYKGGYFNIAQYSSARAGIGFDLQAGYTGSIDSYSYDVGYVNYVWQVDQDSSLSLNGADDIYLKNNYILKSTKLFFNIYQRTLTVEALTLETGISYTKKGSYSVVLALGMVQNSLPDRNFVQLDLSLHSKLTGGAWLFTAGYTDNADDTEATTYSIAHKFSF